MDCRCCLAAPPPEGPCSLEARGTPSGVVSMAGTAQYHVLCGTGNSQACSDQSCGHARGQTVREAQNEGFVTEMYACHLRLARANVWPMVEKPVGDRFNAPVAV
eukprot:4606993-Prymnesium_polylepis.1